VTPYVSRFRRPWGSGGRGFKSPLPDQSIHLRNKDLTQPLLPQRLRFRSKCLNRASNLRRDDIVSQRLVDVLDTGPPVQASDSTSIDLFKLIADDEALQKPVAIGRLQSAAWRFGPGSGKAIG